MGIYYVKIRHFNRWWAEIIPHNVIEMGKMEHFFAFFRKKFVKCVSFLTKILDKYKFI